MPTQISQAISKDEKKKEDNTGHRKRVKAKFRGYGIEPLADYEILEFLLFFCIPRKDTKTIAKEMLHVFGTLYNLMNTDIDDIMRQCDVTEHAAILLTLVPQLLRKYQQSKWKHGIRLSNSKICSEYCKTLFTGKTIECLYVLCMDSNRNLIFSELVSVGTTNQTTVYMRNLVKTVLKPNINAIILSHNHPSGVLQPSDSDIELTNKAIRLFNILGINVDDHIIVSEDRVFSLYESGLIPHWRMD